MKAVSIQQPWASLIAHGIKDIENRTWRIKFRGTVFIHASAKWVKHNLQGDMYDDIQWAFIRENAKYCLPFLEPNCIGHRLPVSAIIGQVDIVDCVINHPSIWAEKTFMYEAGDSGEKPIGKPIYNWVLANAVLYDKPILNVKGALSFWEPEDCLQECIACGQYLRIEDTVEDDGNNYYHAKCHTEMLPFLLKDAEENPIN